MFSNQLRGSARFPPIAKASLHQRPETNAWFGWTKTQASNFNQGQNDPKHSKTTQLGAQPSPTPKTTQTLSIKSIQKKTYLVFRNLMNFIVYINHHRSLDLHPPEIHRHPWFFHDFPAPPTFKSSSLVPSSSAYRAQGLSVPCSSRSPGSRPGRAPGSCWSFAGAFSMQALTWNRCDFGGIGVRNQL